jgi:hypothetical protein
MFVSFQRSTLPKAAFNSSVIPECDSLEGCLGLETHCLEQIYLIEFQKRGLPHPHLLIFLKNPVAHSDIDKIISAEIPEKHSVVYNLVSKFMVHTTVFAYNYPPFKTQSGSLYS